DVEFQGASRLSARRYACAIDPGAVYVAAVKQPRFTFLSAHCAVSGATRLTRESSGRGPRRLLAVCYLETGVLECVAMTSASPPNPTSLVSSLLLYGL